MRPGLTGKDEQGELKVVEVVDGHKLEKKINTYKSLEHRTAETTTTKCDCGKIKYLIGCIAKLGHYQNCKILTSITPFTAVQ